MKKYFPRISKILLTSVIVFGVNGLLLLQTVHASPENPNEPCEYVPFPNGTIPDVPTNAPCEGKTLGDFLNQAPLQSTLSAGIDDAANSVVEWVLKRLATFILTLTSYLTGLAAIVLNGAVFYTVVKVSENYASLTTISETWKVVRDIANMGFIFVLLYAAIRQIIGASQDNQKLIVKVVTVAILINFSLFFTRVVIDISNVLALTFYDAIAPEALSIDANWTEQKGLSNAFMQHLNLQTLYEAPNLNSTTIITIGVFGSIMLLIAAFVFFAVALLFIIRYVILILVLVLSPIAFVAYILPSGTGIEKYRKQWVDALLGQSFFAPIYFMLTWVTLSILSGVTKSFGAGTTAVGSEAGLGGLASVVGGTINSGAFIMLINFIIVIVLLIASLMIAKEWANKAGGGIGKLTSWATGTVAGGATFGLAARAGRYGLGGAAEVFKESKLYKRLEARSPDSAMARLTLAAADKTRKASFDVRGSRVGGILAGVGLEAGQAQQGGIEAERKAVEEFFERPGTEAHKKRQERGRAAQNELDIIAGATLGAPAGAVTAMEKAMAKMSDKEIEAIVDSNRKLLESQAFANALSVKQLEALNKSDKISETEKDTLKARRFNTINAAMAVGGAGAAAVAADIKALSDPELEMINPAYLTDQDFVGQLRGGQVEAINKSNKFTRRQKDEFKAVRREPLDTAIAAGNAAVAQDELRKFSPKEITALGMPTMTNPIVLGAYTPNVLKRMATEMNTANIQTLRTLLLVTFPAGTATGDWLRDANTGVVDFS
ncbi:MAG: hypothetical protein HYT69_01295 [Candidatus Zambryskibacteria bacterium]|nr:hypothetical protein [Candidatus Zambryskibacteria bacterium]